MSTEDFPESDLEAFERALLARQNGFFRLRLYVSGSTPRSSTAIANIRALCERHLVGRYELEVVDLYQEPQRARDCQVIAAPTLVRELPEPSRRIIGDMSDEAKVMVTLEMVQPE